MNLKPPPDIDDRTAAEITALLAGTGDQDGLLQTYTTHPDASRRYPFSPWAETDPLTGAPRGRSAALIGIFSRFVEILIERLNRVPEKNFLAFLDLLGAERVPPRPARVPVTFTLAAGSTVAAEVPAGTRVAAPPAAGAKDPVEFETEQALTVTAARLDALLTLDPTRDTCGDWSAIGTDFPVFAVEPAGGGNRIEHILYIGDAQLLAYAEIKNLRLRVTLESPLPDDADDRKVQWQVSDGSQWRNLTPKHDPTEHLKRSGTIHFGPVAVQPGTTVDGRQGRWLRCRLLTPITPSADPVDGMVRASQLPRIKRMILAVHLERTLAEGITPDLGFTNGAPLDLGKAFFPFGERPRRYDTWFLASAEAFSKDRTASLAYSSARVELGITLANSHLSGGSGGVRPSGDLALAWECWSGSAWVPVGTSTAPDWLALLEIDPADEVPADSTDQRTLLVQGTATFGARVSARVLGERDQPGGPGDGRATLLRVGPDGRFARRFSLSAGCNVIQLEATLDGGQHWGWVAVHAPAQVPAPIELAVTFEPSQQPVDQDRIELQVKVGGTAGEPVAALRLTNGRNGKPDERDRNQAFPVQLEPGRNDLLIEGLDAEGHRLAATLLTVSRTAPAPDPVGDFSDGTFALTQSGVVRFRLPATTAKTAVNGQDGYWLRVRITDGDCGKAASYVLKDPVKPEDGFLLVPETFRPPIVSAIRIGYELTPRRAPPLCLAYNQLAYVDCAGASAPLTPFVASGAAEPPSPYRDRPALYLGLALPSGRAAFPRTGLSLYARREEPQYDAAAAAAPTSGGGPARIAWQYWNGATWAGLRVEDGTDGFNRSGLLSLLPPADFASRALFGQTRWWLRARWEGGSFTRPPRLAWLRLNTTPAVQALTVTGETLGSSNGGAGQCFRSARAPVLAGQQLEVRESEPPGAEDLAALQAEEGVDAVRIVSDSAGRPREVWVRWHGVPDLYGSGPADRHYTINHLTGEVRFGDGVNGRIPPPGASNLRLARYRTGGGTAGNSAAGTVAQLKTTVPYVDKAANPEGASGGAEAETTAEMLARTPRTLRHQDRAVTPEDFEDLALLATTEVARARCVPLRDLEAVPLGQTPVPGVVSVIIVPRSSAAKPLPTLALLDEVRACLTARADATARLAVVGPAYLQVSVRAEVAVVSPTAAAAVERAVLARLDAFLHPLTGGLDGQGWDFGRTPHRSDFHTLIEQVPGVDHCRRLALIETEDLTGVRASGRFLVYAGTHEISLVFPQT